MNKKLISFSVSEMEPKPSLHEINDSQFMKIRIRAFSDGITRHGYGFNLDTLKESGFTLLGKPILYKYDLWNDDCSAHEPDEIQCGFIPKDEKDADITFEYDDNLKKTFVCVTAYIWKVYQEKLVDILSRDEGYKHISCEMWVIESDESKKKELGYIPVYQFCFNGLSILGDHITEACEGSDMEVVKFSTDEYEKAQDIFIKQLHNSINQESNQDSFLIQKNSNDKEEVMAKELDNSANTTPEVLENGEKVKTVSVNVSEYTDTYDDDGKFVEGTSEHYAKSETTVEPTDDAMKGVNNADPNEQELEKVDNACIKETNASDDLSVKCSALEVKCSTLESELEMLKNSCSALELKCTVLEEYKTNKENEEKTLSIECALNEMSGVLSVDEISDWRNKALNCSSVDGFVNELKAFAFDKQKSAGGEVTETLRNALPKPSVSEPSNVWERLENSIK